MKKQCGTCKWWDMDTAVLNNALLKASDCMAPIPACVKPNRYWMLETEGITCPTYVQMQTDGMVIV